MVFLLLFLVKSFTLVESIAVLRSAHFVLYTHFFELIDLDIQELQTEKWKFSATYVDFRYS